jgi:hypothetical protein
MMQCAAVTMIRGSRTIAAVHIIAPLNFPIAEYGANRASTI